MPKEIQLVIRRRLAVDGRISLFKLHYFTQAVFGWTDSRFHEFNLRYGIPSPENARETAMT